MSNKIEMTEEKYENDLTHSFQVGISSGLEQASKMLMTKAAEFFTNNNDDESKLLRKLSNELLEESNKSRPNNKK